MGRGSAAEPTLNLPQSGATHPRGARVFRPAGEALSHLLDEFIRAPGSDACRTGGAQKRG